MNSLLKHYIINYINTRAKEVLPHGRSYSLSLVVPKEAQVDSSLSNRLNETVQKAGILNIPTNNKFSVFCDDSMEEFDPENFHFFGFGNL